MELAKNGELEKFNCETCTENLKKIRGCNGEKVKLIFRGEREPIVLDRCPLLLIDSEDLLYLQQYKLLVAGFDLHDDSALFADYVLLFSELLGSSKLDLFLSEMGDING